MTLKELSQILGLSPTTVSRALAGYPEVREETRQRVREAAVQHGYSPNRRAAALATGRARAIGHVIPSSRGRDIINPIFADFISGAGGVYARSGYDLILSVVPDGEELAVYRQMAATGSVDGIILHGPRIGDRRIAMLRDVALPFVVHGRAFDAEVAYNYVDVDNRSAFRRATELLLDLGHSRIALLNGPRDMDFARRRYLGYGDALVGRGVDIDPSLLFWGEMSEASGHDAARAMLEGPEPPTALLVSSLIMAIGLRRAAEGMDLRLGRDLSVVTHDDVLGYLANGDETPIFTATRSSVRAAATRCAELLLEVIADPTRPPHGEVWQSDLVIGTTTGPAP